MNILIINNGQKEPTKILELISAHTSTVFELSDGLVAIDTTNFDLIILTGSSQFPIPYSREHIEPELAFIRNSKTPILGICYGAELIQVAFGGALHDVGETNKFKGIYTVTPTTPHPIFLGQSSFTVYEAHRWVMENVPEELEVIAISETGPEIIRHRTRPIYGFQFHPEQYTQETFGDEVFCALLQELTSS